jgi:sulfur carrier protein
MRVHLHPQRRTVEVAGRRSVGRLLAELNVLPSTAMVIRRDELLTDGEMVEDDDEIEIRAVISGGSEGGRARRQAGAPGRPSEHGREAAARTGAIVGSREAGTHLQR